MTKSQESVRKDIERIFGVLQGRFEILRNEMLEWSNTSIVEILHACVIIHNMIVKIYQSDQCFQETDECGHSLTSLDLISEFVHIRDSTVQQNLYMNSDNSQWMSNLISFEESIRDYNAHIQLRSALQEHLLSSAGNN